MAFVKVAYVGHFLGTEALEVSQIRHTNYTPVGASKAARIAGTTDNEIRDIASHFGYDFDDYVAHCPPERLGRRR